MFQRSRRYVTTHQERIGNSFSRQAFMSTLGADLAAVVEGGVEIRLPFSPNLTQQNGYLHAGVITAVLDSACGYAALSVAPEDREVLTVEFKVNLLAPAAGEVFAARAQVKKAGRTLTVCAADAFAISDGREKLVATMLATIMAVPIRPAK
ncbi:MAG: PaaI family thioesterase [Candidatus Sulfotelmatobacter sp.]